MALTLQQKQSILKTNARHEKDTGSPESQIALLTYRINQLTAHLKENAKDFSTRRGLEMMVGKRRRLQKYFKANATPEQYKDMLNRLNLRK
jgi:small subunit ribosomal protein S15